MSYRTILQSIPVEIEVKRSRFIGRASPVSEEADAWAFIESVQQEHRQATHNCSCYRVGEAGIYQRYSDDGEPQGTAGMPMLEVLRKEDITNCAVVVTRYFGGIKLGAAGLVRTYARVCREAVVAGQICTYAAFQRIRLGLSYAALGRVDYYIKEAGFFESSRDFSDRVQVELYLRDKEVDTVYNQLMERTAGELEWEAGPQVFLATDDRGGVLADAFRKRFG